MSTLTIGKVEKDLDKIKNLASEVRERTEVVPVILPTMQALSCTPEAYEIFMLRTKQEKSKAAPELDIATSRDPPINP